MLRVLCGVKGCEETATVSVEGRSRQFKPHWRMLCPAHAKRSKRKRVPEAKWTFYDGGTLTVPGWR